MLYDKIANPKTYLHSRSLAGLRRPNVRENSRSGVLAKMKYIWMNGKMLRWKEATVHVSSPVVNSGMGVFEGIRAYWSKERSQLYIFRLKEHVQRLFDSSKVHRMKIKFSKKQVEDAIVQTAARNGFREDLYIRPLVFRGGIWRMPETPIDVIVFVVPTPRPERMKRMKRGVRCCISSWRRIPDIAMPARVKTCGNYVNSRIASMEAEEAGYDGAIFLTIDGKVSEGSGANIFLVRKRTLITPGVTSDILEGITRETLLSVGARELGIDVCERDVDRTELYVADEAFLCGTGQEVTPIVSVDGIPIGKGSVGSITKKMQKWFFEVVEGKRAKHMDWLTPVYA